MNHARIRGEGTQRRTDYTCVLSYMECDVACAVRESGESAERASGAARVLRGAVDFKGICGTCASRNSNAWHSDVVMMGIGPACDN